MSKKCIASPRGRSISVDERAFRNYVDRVGTAPVSALASAAGRLHRG
jgi:hypothetical protein